jgi:cobalt ECF transporter T component CbiQ
VTAALVIQAFFFADGGVFALGANCFTMGFVEPMLGYALFRMIAGAAPSWSGRALFASAFGAYVAIVAASLVVAIFLGIQPAFFHTASGQALYFPFGLKVTIAGMVPTHMVIAGPVEAVVTAAALRFAVANGIKPYGIQAVASAGAAPKLNRIAVAFLALLALSPLGLLASGDAWGEWDPAGVKERVGYVPVGIARQEERGWKGLGVLADYGSDRGPAFYLLSAFVGAGVLIGGAWLAGRAASKPGSKDGDRKPPPPAPPAGSGGELPAWLLASSSEDRAPEGKGRSAKSFVEKSIVDMAESAQTVVFGEASARRDGLLQRFDARAKLVVFVVLIVVASRLHSWMGLGLFFAMAVGLAAASRIGVGGFLKRVWLTVPVVVGVIALPATLNVVTRGTPVLVLTQSPFVAVTREGLWVAGTLAARVGVALSFAVLLTLTTPWHELLRALRSLLVPRVFVLVLSTTYRYLELVLRSAREMLIARRSRTVGPGTSREARRYVGGAFGALFGRSMRLADEVQAAMVSRGFSGDVRTVAQPRLRLADFLLAGGLALVALVAIGIERLS